jgi:hypothetical protein
MQCNMQAFYGIASHTSNPGLVDISGWQSMSITQAAQAVQVRCLAERMSEAVR